MRDHREIEARVADLEQAASNLSGGAGHAAALATIADVAHYFASAAARHHAYEEEVLFPRLRQLDDFAQMVPALEFQHKMNDDAYAELRAAVEAGDAKRIALVAPRFAEMHRAHIMAEERSLFAVAATKLSADVLEQLARDMPR
jgi:hemerythrin-like domain-containing protein